MINTPGVYNPIPNINNPSIYRPTITQPATGQQKPQPTIKQIGAKVFNTDSNVRIGMSLALVVLAPPLLLTERIIKANVVADKLVKGFALWGFSYLWNGVIDTTIKKQIAYSGNSFNIFKPKEQQ